MSTEDEGAVTRRLPSPGAFDHVVVRASVDGRVAWLEPTRSLERAALGDVEPPPYGAALVVGPGDGAFERIPDRPAAPLDVVTTYRVARFGAPVELGVETTLVGRRAVAMRHELAARGAAEVERTYLEFYARQDPEVRTVRPLEVEDAAGADRLVLRERYELPPFSAGQQRDFVPDGILFALRRQVSTLRKLPLRVEHPVLVRERVRVELPGPPRLLPEDLVADLVVEDEAATLERRSRVEGNRYTVELSYRTRQPVVGAAAVPRHVQTLDDMRRAASFRLALAVRGSAAPLGGERGGRGAVALAWAVVALLAVVALVTAGSGRRWAAPLRSWRRIRAFRAKRRLDAGEAPAAPLVVRSPEEAVAAASRLRCACGERLGPPLHPGDRIRFDGRELIVHVLACARCAGRRPTYFALGPGDGQRWG